jgi:NAD(P)-dependent dehydrogenase (short-subunit alcohol dehydrogenase family)
MEGADGQLREAGKMAKVALITGAGTGIGKASALALAQEGYDVVLGGRRREPLEAVAEEARATGRQALAVPTDVADPASVEALFARARETFGRLDLLFNNAGVGAPAVPLEELPFEKWKAVIDTILTGSFLCTREAIKIMKSQEPMGGRIINNGSISAYAPRPNSAPYTSAKHAIGGLTKSTSLDGRKYDIACGQIDVGNAHTDMAARMKDGVMQADGSIRPEPLMDVAHVARAVAHMASLPPDANIQFLTVMATKMPFVGRG